MAFILNPDAQLVFFTQVFGPGHSVTKTAKNLIASGVVFETSMYGVKATYKGKVQQVNLTIGTNSLMKHTVEYAVEQQNKDLIAGLVSALAAVIPNTITTDLIVVKAHWNIHQPKPNVIALIKAIRTVTGFGLAMAKELAEKVLAGHAVELALSVSLSEAQATLAQQGVTFGPGPATTSFVEATIKAAEAMNKLGNALASKPVDKVIDLKSSQALGQKVHGTSQGSVYYTIAVGDHVKVAARMFKGGGISIRAEWTDSPTADLKKLEESGVQLKGNYGSIHFDAGDVPLPRVIGAFLVGTGINWQAAVMNGSDLVIGDK